MSFTLYMFIPHCKIFKVKSTHPDVCQCRRTSGQLKESNTATFQFQRKLLVLWGNLLFETRSLQYVKMEKVYYEQNCKVKKSFKDVTLHVCLQNLGFEKSMKNSCDGCNVEICKKISRW